MVRELRLELERQGGSLWRPVTFRLYISKKTFLQMSQGRLVYFFSLFVMYVLPTRGNQGTPTCFDSIVITLVPNQSFSVSVCVCMYDDKDTDSLTVCRHLTVSCENSLCHVKKTSIDNAELTTGQGIVRAGVS